MASLSFLPSRSKSTPADSSEFFTVNINAGSIKTELSNDAAMTEARRNRDKRYVVGRILAASSALVAERRRLWHIVPPLHLHLLVETQGFCLGR
ncbi:unnamed protein product [Cuscuta campestris]|uniref:Uncharacterized protein n=1 Tax=Cuscuta campestris TaxID=132261 RepID=A0A484K707_9ASTE|nr:unnamed protein product [Cuscuta campestris]